MLTANHSRWTPRPKAEVLLEVVLPAALLLPRPRNADRAPHASPAESAAGFRRSDSEAERGV